MVLTKWRQFCQNFEKSKNKMASKFRIALTVVHVNIILSLYIKQSRLRNHLKSRHFSLDFKCLEPFKIQTHKTSRFQMVPYFEWSDFESPLYLVLGRRQNFQSLSTIASFLQIDCCQSRRRSPEIATKNVLQQYRLRLITKTG